MITIKVTSYLTKDRVTVNTPRSHAQRYPRVYASSEKANERVEELCREHPEAVIERVVV